MRPGWGLGKKDAQDLAPTAGGVGEKGRKATAQHNTTFSGKKKNNGKNRLPRALARAYVDENVRNVRVRRGRGRKGHHQAQRDENLHAKRYKVFF